MIDLHPYSGRVASVATRHEKGKLISPALSEVIGLTVIEVDVDTDSLGTFAGEVPRTGTPRDTAIAKARMGMTKSGLSLGLANEGTIGPHPAIPLLVFDVEIIVFVDDELGLVVSEIETEFNVPTLFTDIEPNRLDDVQLSDGGFPEHGLIVHPTTGLTPMYKGIHDREILQEAVFECARNGKSSTVRIESDLRAHHHPSRQLVIARAADRLARRLASLCRRCGAPGWGVARREAGARCSHCGGRTRQVRFEHYECSCCDFTEIIDVSPDGGVDPMHCPRCNP